jgi:hypothetical protein
LYIFLRGLGALSGYPLLISVYIPLYVFLFLSYIIARILDRKYQNKLPALFIWIGSFWLGAMLYFFLIVLLIDILKLVNLIIPFFQTLPFIHSIHLNLYLFSLSILIVTIILFTGYLNSIHPHIRNLNININKPGGKFKQIRLAAASDIHLGTIISKSRIKRIVEKINGLNPDLVLLPGDVIDEDIRPVIKNNLGEILRQIKSKYGVYGITGNHEYIGGVVNAKKYLTEHNIKLLNDDYVEIEDSLYLIGREDRSIRGFAGLNRKLLDEILKGANKSKPLILMDHQPVKFIEAEENKIDLQLSGHTHHGQVWPFNFITKRVFEISMGYKKRGDTHYYVSCGVGTWGPPVRTNCRPEVLCIDIGFGN